MQEIIVVVLVLIAVVYIGASIRRSIDTPECSCENEDNCPYAKNTGGVDSCNISSSCDLKESSGSSGNERQ